MRRFVCFSWVLMLAVCPSVWALDDIESSISTDSMGSLRFYGVTKTMTTTTTLVHLHTAYVHQSCLYIPLGTPSCPITTPPPPTTPAPTTTTTTTTTPATTTTTTQATTTTSSTTTAATTTTTGTSTTTSTTPNTPFTVVNGTGQFKPSVSTSITVNKFSPPKIQFNLPQLLGGQGNFSGLGNFFNKKPVNITMGANMTASVNSGAGRRRRSEIQEANIQPSLVRPVEMTASPEMTLREAIQQDVEASRAEEYHEYEIVGLMPHHFAERANLPFFGAGKKLTIVRVDPVTVTVDQTVTSIFPFASPSDRVTVAYSGCVPSKVPDLPHCV